MPAVGTQDRCQRCGMRSLLNREGIFASRRGRSSRRCTCQMGYTLSHRCSGASGIQADAGPTAKLKTHSAIVFMTMVAVALIPHLSSGELLPSASVQTAEASPPPSHSPQHVPSETENGSAVDVLSDTRGVNFSPYLKEILPAIRGRWVALLQEQAHPPTSAKGRQMFGLPSCLMAASARDPCIWMAARTTSPSIELRGVPLPPRNSYHCPRNSVGQVWS